MPMKTPPQPGRSVRTACLEPLGLSIAEGAKILGVARLSTMSSAGPEMAIRLTKAFGSAPETWLATQLAHDLAGVRKNESKIKAKSKQNQGPAATRGGAAGVPSPMERTRTQAYQLADPRRNGGRERPRAKLGQTAADAATDLIRRGN